MPVINLFFLIENEENKIQISLAGLFYPVTNGKVDMTSPQPQVIVSEIPETPVTQAEPVKPNGESAQPYDASETPTETPPTING